MTPAQRKALFRGRPANGGTRIRDKDGKVVQLIEGTKSHEEQLPKAPASKSPPVAAEGSTSGTEAAGAGPVSGATRRGKE